MENQTAQENAPLLAGVKLSTALSSFTSPKEKQKDAGKVFKAPAPVLKERNIKEERKRGTPPNPVKVPPKSLFSYPERYMSPTDSMVSPVTRGLLARNRKPMRALNNPWGPPKALETTFQGASQEEKPLNARVMEKLPAPKITS